MDNGVLRPMLRSLLLSYVLSAALLAALAFALYKLQLGEGIVNLLIYGVYFVTCLAGGLAAGKRIRQRRFFWGLLSGLAYFLVLFIASWILDFNAPMDTGRAVIVMGICSLGGTLGGMMS